MIEVGDRVEHTGTERGILGTVVSVLGQAVALVHWDSIKRYDVFKVVEFGGQTYRDPDGALQAHSTATLRKLDLITQIGHLDV